MMQFHILPPMIFGLHENRAEAEAFVSEWAVEGCGTFFFMRPRKGRRRIEHAGAALMPYQPSFEDPSPCGKI